MYFKKRALRSATVRAFWGSICSIQNKRAVIESYEVEMLEKLKWGNLRCDVLYKLPERLAHHFVNPTIRYWNHLLKAGMPFIKVQLLRDNPTNENIDNWKQVVQAAGFDARLAESFLRERFPEALVFSVRHQGSETDLIT